MSQAPSAATSPAASATDLLLPDLLALTAGAVEAADTMLAQARAAVFERVAKDGKVSAAAIEH
jgi:(2S)-methylsuccinyl-CoA dehydrogenase